MSDYKEENVGCGWTRVSHTHTSDEYSTGWRGVIDAIKAWWTGEDRTRYQNSYTYSMYVNRGIDND